jgi:hypothetical protein
VIDVQEKSTFPEALKYFKSVYNHTKPLSPQLIVTVLFHKVDPNLAHMPTTEVLMQSLSKEIRKIVEDGEIGFYRTTVYDPASVISAFSRPILGSQPIYDELSTLFANFAVPHDIEYMSLLVNHFELGSFKVLDIQQAFIAASIQFYQQFNTLENSTKIPRIYEFENYVFQLAKGQTGNYQYMLNLAYPISNKKNAPSEQEFLELHAQIADLFLKYQPKFT